MINNLSKSYYTKRLTEMIENISWRIFLNCTGPDQPFKIPFSYNMYFQVLCVLNFERK